MYSHFVSQVQTPEGLTEGFLTSAGVLQGCLLSPHLFNLFLNAALSFAETVDGAEIVGKLMVNWHTQMTSKTTPLSPHHHEPGQKPATPLAWPYPANVGQPAPKNHIRRTGSRHAPRGRPRKRWTDNFLASNLPQLLRLAQDRSTYRRHIHHLFRREEAPIQPQRPDGT